MKYLYINVTDTRYSPGIKMVHGDKVALLEEFAEFMAEVIQEDLVKAIDTQRYKGKWKPLSFSYLQYKKQNNLSLKMWEASGLLKKSIKVYKRRNCFMVGIDKHVKYKKTGLRVYDIACKLEYGDSTVPARPLFRPVISHIQKNIRRYWYKFLRKKGLSIR